MAVVKRKAEEGGFIREEGSSKELFKTAVVREQKWRP
jgi:hypothetical protein